MKNKSIILGYLYSYIHFIVEIACFYYLSKVSTSLIVWLVPFLYDAFAFVPQSLIGAFSDKYKKLNLGLIGMLIILLAVILLGLSVNKFIILFIICFGNCCVHVNGAQVTLRNANGKLSHSAIFVAGGSFGVISGRLLAKTTLSPWILVPIVFSAIPFTIIADRLDNKQITDLKFNYNKDNISKGLIIFLAVFVVIVRGYMGYGIPTSWNKTVIQNVIFFITMGLGKALGGILSDKFGIRKVAIWSTLLAIPFLCVGDNLMIVSIIGVMMFSMTMSITLAILVSALPKHPGLAFGLTTIGLFLGTAPIFFIKITSKLLNIGMIIVLSILCSIILGYILKERKDG